MKGEINRDFYGVPAYSPYSVNYEAPIIINEACYKACHCEV